MLHESKKLEQRFAQNQQVINSLDNSLVHMHHHNQKNLPIVSDPNVGTGLFNSNFNDVAEFQIYDRKFKHQAVSGKQQQDLNEESRANGGSNNMYDTPSF